MTVSRSGPIGLSTSKYSIFKSPIRFLMRKQNYSFCQPFFDVLMPSKTPNQQIRNSFRPILYDHEGLKYIVKKIEKYRKQIKSFLYKVKKMDSNKAKLFLTSIATCRKISKFFLKTHFFTKNCQKNAFLLTI